MQKDVKESQSAGLKQQKKQMMKLVKKDLYEQKQYYVGEVEEKVRTLSYLHSNDANLVDYFYNLQLIFPQRYYDLLKTQELLPIYDWAYVLHIKYRTFEDMKCPICLVDYFEMVSPHMAFCGHIFCIPCLFRHMQDCNICLTQARNAPSARMRYKFVCSNQ
jgi:hypothetical protein